MITQFCRACSAPSDRVVLDARSVCVDCSAKLAAGWQPTEAYCRQCGMGPGLPHIFDARGVCWQCRQTRAAHGIQPLGPPLRASAPCAHCGGGSFVRVGMRERGTSGGDHAWERAAPFALTFAIEPGGATDLAKPIGLLEAYVCRRCGFTELYTRNASEIPIGDNFGTEAFEVGGGPFR